MTTHQPPDPLFNGSGTIVREIYDAVLRLTGRVDTLISQHDETRTDLKDHELRIRAIENADKKDHDHEARLKELERNRWPLPSLALLVSLAALILAAMKQFGNN